MDIDETGDVQPRPVPGQHLTAELGAVNPTWYVAAGYALAAVLFFVADRWLLVTTTTTVDVVARAGGDRSTTEVELPGPDLFFPAAVCAAVAIAVVKLNREDVTGVAAGLGIAVALGLMALGAPFAWLGVLPAGVAAFGLFLLVRDLVDELRPEAETDDQGVPRPPTRPDSSVGL